MDIGDPKIRRASGPLSQLLIGWLTMFVVGSDLFIISPLLPLIAVDYAIPPVLAGLTVAVFSAAYMLSAPLLGYIADRIGRRQTLTYCLCAFSVANLLTAIAGNLAWLLAARLIAGATAAGVSPSLYALIGSAAPSNRRGSWLAIVVSGLLMSLSFGAPTGLAAASFGWPAAFAGLGVLGLLLVWANRRVWHQTTLAQSVTPRPGNLQAGHLAARLAPTMVWSTALYGMYTYLGEGLTALGNSAEEIAAVILLYGCGAISGVLIGGRMADQLGAKPTTAIALLGLCSCFLLLIWRPIRHARRLRLRAHISDRPAVLSGAAVAAGERVSDPPGDCSGVE